MAEDLASEQRGLPGGAEPLVLRDPRPVEYRPAYRYRFAFAYLALAVIAGIAIGAAVLLADRPAEQAAPAWSAWQPEGADGSYPSQIADHVSRRYRGPSGDRLAVVLAGPLAYQGVPVETAVIQGDTGDPDDLTVVDTGKSVMYRLCGDGDACSLEGTATPEALRLLRREALELALYSFTYVEGLDTTVVLLPPNLGDPQDPSDDAVAALLLRRADLRAELDRPLQQTLARPTAPVTTVDAAEQPLLKRLTGSRIYQYEFRQLQGDSAMLYLIPVPGIE